MSKIFIIILVIIGFFILWGPIMLFFSKLNKVDPFILEKNPDDKNFDERSFIIVSILRPLFSILWLERKIFMSFKKK